LFPQAASYYTLTKKLQWLPLTTSDFLHAASLLDCQDSVALAFPKSELIATPIDKRCTTVAPEKTERSTIARRSCIGIISQLIVRNQSMPDACSRNATIIDDARRIADERSRISCGGGGCLTIRHCFQAINFPRTQ